MTDHLCNHGRPPGGPPAPGPSSRDEECERRTALIDGLKSQIREGAYRPDVRDLARSLANMLVRDL